MRVVRIKYLKILLLSNKVPYPPNDGSTIAIASIVDGLLKNQIPTTVLSINTLKHFRETKEIDSSKPQSLDLKWVDINTNVTFFGALSNIFSGHSYAVSRFYDAKFLELITKTLSTQSFDVIQLEGLAMAVYIKDLRQLTKAPIVLRAHNVEFEIWERHLRNEKNFLKKWYLQLQTGRLRKFEIQTLKTVDAVLPITTKDENTLRSLGFAGPMYTIPCGVDPAKYGAAKVPAEADITYLASFDWMPNVQGMKWFLDCVWPILLDKKPDIKLFLGGRKIPHTIKDQQSDSLRIFEDVKSMQEFIGLGRITIVPLLAGSGMRIKIIEQMAMGKTIVSTSIGAEGIEAEDGRDIVIADSPENFAEAVLSLLDTPSRIEQMGQNAIARIKERYSNQKLGTELSEFYQTLK